MTLPCPSQYPPSSFHFCDAWGDCAYYANHAYERDGKTAWYCSQCARLRLLDGWTVVDWWTVAQLPGPSDHEGMLAIVRALGFGGRVEGNNRDGNHRLECDGLTVYWDKVRADTNGDGWVWSWCWRFDPHGDGDAVESVEELQSLLGECWCSSQTP